MNCIFCRGATKKAKVDVVEVGVNLGKFDAQVCTKCGEHYYSETVVNQIQKKEKEAGIWGLEAKTEVSQYGNSLAIRVKKKLADFLKLKKGTQVEIKLVEPKKILVEVIG
ncbi:hypothetical protein HZC09_01395 [Candidatus Micrarchaeota archaeon]|nr:hypothetical protein [Candidatus Micrarchaeota archaeon]